MASASSESAQEVAKRCVEHDELDEAPPITTRQEEINKVLFFLMLAQSIVFTEAGSIP